MTAGEPRLYLDFNAGAPLLAEARAAAIAALDAANPSSVHVEGRRARALVEDSRRAVAQAVGAVPRNVVFTSSATEAATTALSPHWLIDGVDTRISQLAVLDTDHPCIREGGQFPTDAMTRLPVDANGIVDLGAVNEFAARCDADRPGLLALTLGNSETGVMQPMDGIRAALAGQNVRLVVDAVQALGRVPLDIAETGADALLLSGHKLGALKGVGALILQDESTRPLPLLRGGGQEGGRRAGTEAVTAIVSLGTAIRVAMARLSAEPDRLRDLRDHLEAVIRQRLPDASVLGAGAERLPNTVGLALPGLRAETAQMALDLAGIAVSSGSACSSGKVGRSHVIEAMVAGGLAIAADEGALRVSFGYDTSEAELDRFVDAYVALAGRRRGQGSQDRAA
ncbi:cysteine desulfurase family protein [Aurantimonas endophytica]|uniref:Cysteine desulfurase n=1 Tax=Aurantimonas endophytica TaxID=1522175 RepID=A0A7W6HAN2_9HYPH|nr:aminotransferase class V-fold PLP-dependent enzyme [Aurantimonas endophytica]MBB4001647.1 cysteine desulfurase [Aurantimonas endophytica]MCO6402716.1 aminotransferase class V-fold PLP-dependent enzyme [Aurantimonas endophytica]